LHTHGDVAEIRSKMQTDELRVARVSLRTHLRFD